MAPTSTLAESLKRDVITIFPDILRADLGLGTFRLFRGRAFCSADVRKNSPPGSRFDGGHGRWLEICVFVERLAVGSSL